LISRNPICMLKVYQRFVYLTSIIYSIMLEINDNIFESRLSRVKIEWKILQTIQYFYDMNQKVS
jgi:hypothetical protein